MQFDANNPAFQRAHIRCDVAIVGAGPAGITLAQALRGTKLKVCLLESGGREPDPAADALSSGRVSSPSGAIEPDYITQHSRRLLGGTGSVWGGYCRPLDEVDFQQRELAFSHQWPFPLQELLPFYGWEPLQGKYDRQPVPGSALEIRHYEKLVYPFHQVHHAEFEKDSHIELVLHATVRDIILHGNGSIAHLNVVNTRAAQRGPEKSFQVTARVYVLACGGIGNVKLLLNANGVAKNGIGNERDVVGRYFMEHPHFQFYDTPAQLWLSQQDAPWLYRDERYKPALYFSDAFVRKERLLNFCAMLSPELDDDSQFPGSKLYRPNFTALSNRRGGFYTLALRCEQSPQPDSRVMLSNEKDALGLRRVQLEWRLADADRISLLRNIELLAEELGKASLGRVRLLLDKNDPWKTMVGGGHLMGTTRMGQSPENSVVNADGKMHEIDNLYIAGSSVFPTSGVSNPTLTLMALARRLGQHLRGRLLQDTPGGD